tara:strand:+ start:1256 stop:3304 length:2049 start_codon:yes stop_codon:yes gene_type:complete
MNKKFFNVLNYTSSVTPQFRESQNKEWIDMGSDNLYPHYLEELYSSSSIHSAIVNGISQMIYGEGLNAVSKDNNIEQWLKVNEIFSDKDALKRCAFDLELYGNCYFNIIWSQDRSTISKIHHVPAATVRCGVANDEDQVDIFYHKTNWANNDKPQAVPAFNTSDRTAASQILHIKTYNPLSFYYGLPSYIGSQNYIQVDAALGEYHLNSINNGFFPSTILSFNDGVPTEEERAELERLIYNKFGSASNAGKILMTFNDSAENAPTVESFSVSDAHQVFDYLSKEVSIKILSGHRCTSPLLFGLRSEGGGFGSNAEEMKDAYDLFYNTVVLPMQRLILDGLRPVFAASSITLDLYFTPLKPASFIKVDNLFGATGGADTTSKDASYNGAQISSGLDILVKVQEGLLTEEQAKVFLVQMLQFTPEVADALFTKGIDAIAQVKEEERVIEEQTETQLSKAPDRISQEQGEAWLAHLSERSSPAPKGYVLWKTEDVINTEEDKTFHSYKKMHRAFQMEGDPSRYADYEMDSDYDVISPKGYLFAVRYSYFESAKTPPENPNYKSREFCEVMMDLSNDGAMYRYDDIEYMSDIGVNGNFAHSGGSYDLMKYKGGCFCRHGFKRHIFIYAPDNEIFEFTDQEKEIQGDFDAVMRRVGDNPYVVNEGYESEAPIDMPDRGSILYPKAVN